MSQHLVRVHFIVAYRYNHIGAMQMQHNFGFDTRAVSNMSYPDGVTAADHEMVLLANARCGVHDATTENRHSTTSKQVLVLQLQQVDARQMQQ